MPARIRALDREYQKIIQLQILTAADDYAKDTKANKIFTTGDFAKRY